MNNRYRAQLSQMLSAVQIRSRSTFSWLEYLSSPIDSKVLGRVSQDTKRSYLHSQLQLRLYWSFFCTGGVVPAALLDPSSLDLSYEVPLVQELSRANGGKGRWDTSWEVIDIDTEGISATKDGLTLRASPQYFDGDLAVGKRVRILFPRELVSMSPGYYLALSDASFPEGPTTIARLYWNLRAEGAPSFARDVTRTFNSMGIPFDLKIVDRPHRFGRCDAAVLYLTKSDFSSAAHGLSEIHATHSGNLMRAVPALTKPLLPGLGLAEDSGTLDSYGEHRCRLLATGVLRAHEEGKRALRARLEVLQEVMAESGVDLERPYLNAGQADDYQSLDVRSKAQVSTCSHGKSSEPREIYLKMAERIGVRLCSLAIQHGGLSNWFAPDLAPVSRRDKPASVRFLALGPDLYSGTSGIALFLAYMYEQTNERRFKRVSLGAVRHALRSIQEQPTESQGLFVGWPGVALAALRIGELLKAEEILDSCRILLDRRCRDLKPGRDFDLLQGAAGGSIALLIASRLLGDAGLIEPAKEFGEWLLKESRTDVRGMSWRSSDGLAKHDLTGLAHGASGVSWALLELHHVTGDPRFLEASEAAFGYERSWFDPKAGNWPDFRIAPGQERSNARSSSFSTAWCSGAPGILLTRLRARQILGEEIYREEAVAALEATYRATKSDLDEMKSDFSLCHGLGGNAMIVRYGARILGGEWSQMEGLAAEVAEFGVRQYGESESSWPCGDIVGEVPGLMLGLAGIGWFYLSMWNPSFSFILLPLPESFTAPQQ